MFCPMCGKQLYGWHLTCPHCYEHLPDLLKETVYARHAGGTDNSNATAAVGASVTNVSIHTGNIN